MFFALNNGALPRTETIAHTWHTLVLWCHDSHWTCAFGVGKVDNATDPVVSPSTGSAHGVMLIIILNTAHSLHGPFSMAMLNSQREIHQLMV